MRSRSPYANRLGGRHYRAQLDRIERRLMTLYGLLIIVLIVAAIVYLIRHI